jgi:hypothetical protein
MKTKTVTYQECVGALVVFFLEGVPSLINLRSSEQSALTSAEMDWKTLLTGGGAGAFVGYLGTLFSDPLRTSIERWRRRQLIRKNLYREIAHNYCGLIIFLNPEKLALLEPRFLQNIRDYAQQSVFQYAENQQELVFGMKEWGTIEHLYRALKKIIDKPGPEVPDFAFLNCSITAQQGKTVISMIEETALCGELRIRLFGKVSPDISKRLKEIKRGKRKKSSEIYAEFERAAIEDLVLIPPRTMPPPIP